MRRHEKFLLSVFFLAIAGSWANACTTAVISGRVTADGRPLLWKNRDTSTTLHNEVVILEGTGFRAVVIVDASDRSEVWMGTNAAGFCIENSLSKDLKGATASDLPEKTAISSGQESQPSPSTGRLGNGGFMKLALERCATVEDFRKLLEETNADGRTTVANFGVIDAQGGAAMFETSPHSYQMFDANEPSVAPQGYIVRSNFATTAQHLPPNPAPEQVAPIYAGERFLRACELLDSQLASDLGPSLSLSFILQHMTRDLASEDGQAYPGSVNCVLGTLPEILSTERTISRTTTVSAAVFHGVRAGESPSLTTMWAILGDPKFAIAVPCWTNVEAVADELTDPHGGEIGEIAITLRDWSLTPERTGVRTKSLPGIWQDILPAERTIIAETLSMREAWASHSFTTADMTAFHQSMTARAMAAMEKELREAKQTVLTTAQPIRVAIYDHSADTAKGPKNLQSFLTTDQGFACQRLGPAEIRDGQLSGYQVLIVPGGSGSKQAEMLETDGCDAIRDFVAEGGGYVGICAGSYLASSQYSWSLNLINARVWDRAHWARGTGSVTIGLTVLGSELFDPASSTLSVYYGQGPLLVPGENPDLPPYEVLATYESEIARNGAPSGAMTGTHAIVRGQFGQGRVICFSPHPETSDGPNEFITAAVRWALDAK